MRIEFLSSHNSSKDLKMNVVSLLGLYGYPWVNCRVQRNDVPCMSRPGSS